MKWFKYLLLIFTLSCSAASVSYGQCAMCTLNAENGTKEGNMQGKGLNDGILFLLVIPYLAAAGLGYLWYKKYRKKNPVTKKFLNEIK
ncbi:MULTISPECIES: hypothetical protein [unclassified Sphingobacterium]|uniref:hypothetical protein n=1 Tax=unclassified Sphingobacterium TaxID=2609468 RepID=UPI0025D5C516|nr:MULTISPECIES: hypothetical protein [unclassified Sphingobacterium]MDR6735664.1 hypothetical protein [Sphingobacterium sp. 2149]